MQLDSIFTILYCSYKEHAKSLNFHAFYNQDPTQTFFTYSLHICEDIIVSFHMMNCKQDTTNFTVNKCPLWEDDGNVHQERTLLCQHPSTAKSTSRSSAGKTAYSFLKTEVSACKSWLCSHTNFCGTVLIITSSVVMVSLNRGINTLLTDSRPYPTRWRVTTNFHFINKTGRRHLLGRWLSIIRTADRIRFLLIKIVFASPCLQLQNLQKMCLQHACNLTQY